MNVILLKTADGSLEVVGITRDTGNAETYTLEAAEFMARMAKIANAFEENNPGSTMAGSDQDPQVKFSARLIKDIAYALHMDRIIISACDDITGQLLTLFTKIVLQHCSLEVAEKINLSLMLEAIAIRAGTPVSEEHQQALRELASISASLRH